MNPLIDAEKTDVRRFCGYPVYGAAPVGFQTWRFYQVFGLLEFRLNNLSDTELSVIRRYLVTLTALEQAIPRAGDNMDTDQAAVWTHNKNELTDRSGLFDDWCRRLCGFLGVPFGPSIVSSGLMLVV
jgi:hypothetical protein